MTVPALDDEMRGIFDRADELAKELEVEYAASAERGVVSERAKNLFHEVLVKIRSSLDFVMGRVFRKHSALQGHEKGERERKAGFPICEKEVAFRKKLNDLGLSGLATAKPELYAKLRQPQPFVTVTKHNVLSILRDLSNLGKHARLAKQDVKLRPARRFTGPDGQVTIASEGVSFYREGKPVAGPWPNCGAEDITLATFEAYTEDGEAIFPQPDVLCLSLRLATKRYVAEILPLI